MDTMISPAELAAKTPPAKTLIDYFQPMPIVSALDAHAWGAETVGPRDTHNGLEDDLTHWNYWDGQILRGKDGRYHLFASRWDHSKGHEEWWNSHAISAVSDTLTGPYTDQGLLWPDSAGGKGHNMVVLTLPDGTFAIVASETRPGDVFVSASLDGPWTHLGSIQVADTEFSSLGRLSNVSMIVRPDGDFQIVPRSGAILLSKTGILGPYIVQGPSIYPAIPGMPLHDSHNLEDPVVWWSGGLYHIVINNFSDRKAYHLTSVNGITDWRYRGLACDPTTDFLRYANGVVNHWHKIERPSIFLENGHVAAVTLAVIDVPKEEDLGKDKHGSKVIVIPFDGAALDRDLKAADTAR